MKSFDKHSTADEVLAGVDLSGRRVLITGVSAGLGAETARALAVRGAAVTGTVRSTTKAEAVRARVNAEARTAGGSLQTVPLDLVDRGAVRETARLMLAEAKPFDLVIANAGIMATPLVRTTGGLEAQLATNHLGHFVLVNRLVPLLAPGARVIVVSSGAHRMANVDLEDPGFARTPYDPWTAYGRSKTANILFAVAFDARHRHRGIRAAALHPGIIQTELTRDVSAETMQAFVEATSRLAKEGKPIEYKSIAQGAATTVWAGIVASADEVGGRYCENCHVSDVLSPVQAAASFGEGVMDWAMDEAAADRLWRRSEELVGETFA